MVEAGTKAITKQERPRGLIDSDTFLDYLASVNYFTGADQKFAKQLNLSWLKETFENLYKQRKIVRKNSDEEVERYLAQVRSDNPRVNSRAEKELKDFETKLREVGEAERSQTVYYDYNDDSIKGSEINFGSHTRVTSPISEVHNNGNQPLLEMHTHPGEGLPSCEDYRPLLVNCCGTGRRQVNGIMVLAPDRQILALATNQTPLLNDENAQTLIDEYGGDHLIDEDRERLESLFRRFGYISEIATVKEPNRISNFLDVVRNFEDHAEKGLITMDQAWTLSLIERRIHLTNEAVIKERAKRIMDKAKLKYFAQLHQTIGRRQMEFARAINARLYISTDKANFEAISA